MKSHFSDDPLTAALAARLTELEGSILWLAEEQPVTPHLATALRRAGVRYVSSRYDQVSQLQQLGVAADFHDFEVDRMPNMPCDHLMLRIPKQRALVQYWLNLAPDLLAVGGNLWLAGRKEEGMKTHLARAAVRMGSEVEKIRVARGIDLYRLTRGVVPGGCLDDAGYAELRELDFAEAGRLWTKPGIYGWDKVDQGSRWLAEVMMRKYESLAGRRVLDLGCGYGYLAMRAATLAPARLVATDNQAGAVQAAQQNLAPLPLSVLVTADDCGSALTEKFDLVLCNPPFHQGFAVTNELHRKFMAAVVRLLDKDGQALVVVNAFLRLDEVLKTVGLEVRESLPSTDGAFLVLVLGRRG